MKLLHIYPSGSPPSQTIVAGGKSFYFEVHHYCGPAVLNRRTEAVLDNQPGERSPFWDAVMTWQIQGSRVVDGLCVWEPIPPVRQRVKRLGKRNVVLIRDDAPPVEGETVMEFPPDLLAMLRANSPSPIPDQSPAPLVADGAPAPAPRRPECPTH